MTDNLKLKILHVLDHSIPLHSGYTFRTRAILENQRKLGWKTEHLTSPKHNLATKNDIVDEIVEELHFYRSLPEQGFFSKLPILNQWSIVSATEKRLEEIIEKVKPDILHAHSPALNGLAAEKIGKRHGIPVVYEIRAFWEDAAVDHGTTTEGSVRYTLTKTLETYVAKRANAITTICAGLKEDLISRGISESKITVIPNAVNTDKFQFDLPVDEGLRGTLDLKNKNVIGFIGSFYAYEGIPLLIEALPKLVNENPDVRFLLVGGGPDENNIEKKIKELKMEDYVIRTGRVPHNEVQSYYSLVDVFVYPRLSMRLTNLVTPLKPLEAMAQGRIVVASDVGGHKELIEDGRTGFLFQAGESDALAKVVSGLFSDRNSWSVVRNNARKYVETVRIWANSVGRYEAVYKNVLKESQSK